MYVCMYVCVYSHKIPQKLTTRAMFHPREILQSDAIFVFLGTKNDIAGHIVFMSPCYRSGFS